MRVRTGRQRALRVSGIVLAMLGLVAVQSSVGSPMAEKQAAAAPKSFDERRWLPLEWNGYRKPVAYRHMYYSPEQRRQGGVEPRVRASAPR